jgi:hypothetical protein
LRSRMDRISLALGTLSLSSFLLSAYLATRQKSRRELPTWLSDELEHARVRVSSLIPYAIELVRVHAAMRAGGASKDAGPLSLASLSKALDARLTELDAEHFLSREPGLEAKALAALSGEFRDSAEAEAAISRVLAAHPLRLPPATILAAQAEIVDAEVAAYEAAAEDAEGANGPSFEEALSMRMAAAGGGPLNGGLSLVLPVLSRRGGAEAARAPLWVHIIGSAMAAEAAGDAEEGFAAAFTAIANRHRAALRDLGLVVK